ncbi:MAG TPA: 30S ribosome-binding factor RbfA [Anaeromyxobacteraceae bacterium]|nr:30S ribosome-binding factor RbfA [Anaeromyxobacteraceae bacterium]
MSTHVRPARVAEEFRHELAKVLARGLKDPRVTGFVTVTGAKMSPDLKEATVYVSIHAPEAERERTLEGLRAAAGFLQREVARSLRLRHTPHLRFVYDESVERGDRIERLLKEARRSGPAAADPPPADPSPGTSGPDDEEG